MAFAEWLAVLQGGDSIGIAYLPNGKRIPYEAYLRTAEWKNKKTNRLAFDNWQCGICHKTVSGDSYETHHLSYGHLGDEDIEHDLITLCHECHMTFHASWDKSKNFDMNPYTHWKTYSLPDTALLSILCQREDFICGNGEKNLCSLDSVADTINQYFDEQKPGRTIRISEDDIRLYIANSRYEMFFKVSAVPGFDLEKWLDGLFGNKRVPGGNRKRAEARRFFTKHKPGAMKRIYKENESINVLMKEVRNMKESIRRMLIKYFTELNHTAPVTEADVEEMAKNFIAEMERVAEARRDFAEAE